MATTLAVDLGGTHLRCGAVDATGALSQRRESRTPHDGTGPDALVTTMRTVADATSCTTAVVGVPGRVDYRSGRLEYAPNLDPSWLPALTEQALSAAVGLPVALANDADLATVGEATFGAGRGAGDVAYVTISTGIGAGVVLGGLLVHGRRSLAEIGHTIADLEAFASGAPSTLEQLGSGTALGGLAAEAGLAGGAAAVVAGVRAGQADAERVWRRLLMAVEACVVNLAWLFSPDVVVIGGGIGLVGDVLVVPLAAALEAAGPPGMPKPTRLLPAGLGDDAALCGAAAWSTAFVPQAAGRVGPASRA